MEDPGQRTDTAWRRHIREAATATSFEAGHQIEIQLGHYCNNRCVFCVSGQLTEQGLAQPIGLPPVVNALEDAASKGIKRVTFLGGEPTIQDSFLPALTRAIELGFNDIVIFSNGARGKSRKFLDSVLALGDFTWRFSIQGGNAAAHDAVTTRKGSFAKIAAAMEYLHSRGQDITANMCVNTMSYESLPDYAELVPKYGIRQLHIDMIRPENSGQRTDEYLRTIVPRHTEMAPFVRKMLDGFAAWNPDFDVNIGNMPYCVVPEHADRIHHGGEPTLTLTTGHRGELNTILRKYAFQAVDAVHAPGCEECVFRSGCRGVPEKYAIFYGIDELQPVRLADLPTLDPRQRAFVHEAEPWLVALNAAQPPRGFTPVAVRRDGRERKVELTFNGPRGPATLVLMPAVEPPGDSPSARLVGPRCHVGIVGRGQPLLDWAADLLGLSKVAVSDTREARLARLLRSVRRLKAQRRFGPWQLRKLTSQPGDTVRLELAGPQAWHVVASLSMSAELELSVVAATEVPQQELDSLLKELKAAA